MTYQYAAVTGVLPCPAVIVTVAAGERRDAMTATAFFVSEHPPLLGVSVAEHLLTHDLIELSGEFVVNLATPGQVELVRQLGSTHGRDLDKFEAFTVPTEPAEKLSAPRIGGAYACLECRVVASHEVSAYRVYTAEIVAYEVQEESSPLLWHQGSFFPLGPPVA